VLVRVENVRVVLVEELRDRGDDVLQLCQLNRETAKRFVLKNVPRQSLPAVLGTLAFVSLNRLVLPIVYWFSADRQWGILRPRSTPSLTRTS
jgi:hypothetical protein